MDEWDFGGIHPEQPEPELPDSMADEAAQVLERKSDLTDDKIDWKKVGEEDQQQAQQIASQKRWDPNQFWDPDWCAACELRPRTAESRKQTLAEAVWEACNAAVAQTYENSKMEVVLKTVRDKWVSDLLVKMLGGESPAPVKFWGRRQIYEHLHAHNRTRFVRLVQDGKRFDSIATELFESRIKSDPVTGLSAIDTRVVKSYKELNTAKWGILQELRKEASSGDRRFF